MQLYINTATNLTLRHISSSKKAIKTVLSFKQPLLPILNWVFSAFCTSLLILMFSKHFMVEAINPTNFQVRLKDSNVNMKFKCKDETFSRGALPPEPRFPDPQLYINFCFVKNGMPKLFFISTVYIGVSTPLKNTSLLFCQALC